MTEFYSASSSVSPFTAILWCLYPVAALVIIEILLGGGFDDDNDDQDGGMLIPAYSRSEVWYFLDFKLQSTKISVDSRKLLFKLILRIKISIHTKDLFVLKRKVFKKYL